MTGETATLFEAPVIAVIGVRPSMHHASSWHHPLDPPDLPFDPPVSEVECVLVRVMPTVIAAAIFTRFRRHAAPVIGACGEDRCQPADMRGRRSALGCADGGIPCKACEGFETSTGLDLFPIQRRVL